MHCETVYQNNGFSKVKMTPETLIARQCGERSRTGNCASQIRAEPLSVVYHIDEGQQQRVGELQTGRSREIRSKPSCSALMNTAPGQLFSPQNLAGDRDALLTDYLSRGFDQVQIEVEEQTRSS